MVFVGFTFVVAQRENFLSGAKLLLPNPEPGNGRQWAVGGSQREGTRNLEPQTRNFEPETRNPPLHNVTVKQAPLSCAEAT